MEVEKPAFTSSVAYFCPVCGDIWARALVENTTWRIEATPCESHVFHAVSSYKRIPGSFLTSTLSAENTTTGSRAQTLDVMPNSVLKREFLLSFTGEQSEEKPQVQLV